MIFLLILTVPAASGANSPPSLRLDAGTLDYIENAGAIHVLPINEQPSFELTVGHGQTNSLRLYAWGGNDSQQTNLPGDIDGFTAISADHLRGMALRTNGTIETWGTNVYGEGTVPANATNVQAIAAGYKHSLALLTNGTVIGWGNDELGETTAPSSATNVVSLVAGDRVSGALRADGTAVFWGMNLGIPTNLTGIRQLATGTGRVFALFDDGSIQYWGSDLHGESTTPATLSNDVVAIASGRFHTLALHASGSVSAWGNNGNGQATPPVDLTNAVAIAGTAFGSIALKSDGTLVTWGQIYAWAETPALSNVVNIAGGYDWGLVLTANLVPPVTVAEDSGSFSSVIATHINPGPGPETNQTLTFLVSPANSNLFSVLPAIDSNGTLTFTPAPNVYGTTTVSVVLTDDGGTDNGGQNTSEAQSFTIVILPVDDPVIAADDHYTVNEDSFLSVAAGQGVLINDSDADGDSLAATPVTNPEHGFVSLQSDGSFTYFASFDFDGTDSFQYLASHASGTSELATVTITVQPVNDPPQIFGFPIAALAGQTQPLFGFSVSDVDAGTNIISVDLSSTVASFSATNTDAITVVTEGLAPGAVRLYGTASDLNTFVANDGLQVSVPFGVTTNLTYVITIDDHGHSGDDPGLSGTATNEVTSSTNQLTIVPYVILLAAPADGVYGEGAHLDFVAHFSEPVVVNTTGGTPQIQLTLWTGVRSLTYQSGSGTTDIVFRYTVQAGDYAANSASPDFYIDLNGGTIRDADNNDCHIYLLDAGSTQNVNIDAVAPSIADFTPPADSWYTPTYSLVFNVTFNEIVVIQTNSGWPRMTLTLDNTNVWADYDPDNSLGALVAFRYVVREGDLATNGITVGRLIDANGATIQDTAGNNALLDLGSDIPLPQLHVDGVPPTVAPDDFTLDEDGVFFGSSVLANDFDFLPMPLVALLVDAPTNGQVQLFLDGTFIYTPSPDFYGEDHFTYVASNDVPSVVTTVTLTVQAANDPPTISAPTRITVTNGVEVPFLGVSVDDVDAGTNAVLLTLISGDLGSVFVATNRDGVTVSNYNSVFTFLRGTVPDLNAYFAATNVFYIADTNRETHSNINLFLDDLGHTGFDPGFDASPDSETATASVSVDNGLENEPPFVSIALTNHVAAYGDTFNLTLPDGIFTEPDGQPLRYTAEGLPPGITFDDGTLTLIGALTDVGTYTINVIAGDQQTPELFATNSFQFSVNKAVLIASADNQSRACGAANPPLTVTYSGFVFEETSTVLDTPPSASTSATGASPPGDYPITVSGGDDDHYDFDYVPGVLTITNAPSGGPALGGVYLGLFYETNTVRHESSGAFLIKTTVGGAYSGTLELAGAKFRLAGSFATNRTATQILPRKGLPSLMLSLRLDECTPPLTLDGSVSDGDWTAPLLGYPLSYHAKTNPALTAGRYVLSFPGSEDPTNQPAGHGWGILTVSTAGKLKLKGALADNTKLTDGSSIGEAGLWPFYVPFPRNGGSLIGWIAFTNQGSLDAAGHLAWIKKTRPAGERYYPAGFTNELSAVGTRFVPPGKGTNLFTWTNGIAIAAYGNLTDSHVDPFQLGSGNRVTWLGTNFTTLTLNAKDGRFKGKFIHSATGKPTAFNGVSYPTFGAGAGFFLGTNESGLIEFLEDD